VIPVVFTYVDDLVQGAGRLWRRARPAAPALPAAPPAA